MKQKTIRQLEYKEGKQETTTVTDSLSCVRNTDTE